MDLFTGYAPDTDTTYLLTVSSDGTRVLSTRRADEWSDPAVLTPVEVPS